MELCHHSPYSFVTCTWITWLVLVPSSPIQKTAHVQGTGSHLLVHCPITSFLSLHCVVMFRSRLTSSTLKLEEAASSKILVPVYQITKHHISEDHNINIQWLIPRWFQHTYCFVPSYVITFLNAHRVHKNCSNWIFHNRLVQNYIICMIKMKVNLPLCRPWRPMGSELFLHVFLSLPLDRVNVQLRTLATLPVRKTSLCTH